MTAHTATSRIVQPADIGNRTYLPKTSVTPRAERVVEGLMTISAINALTLSPALCALFLHYTGPRRGIPALPGGSPDTLHGERVD